MIDRERLATTPANAVTAALNDRLRPQRGCPVYNLNQWGGDGAIWDLRGQVLAADLVPGRQLVPAVGGRPLRDHAGTWWAPGQLDDDTASFALPEGAPSAGPRTAIERGAGLRIGVAIGHPRRLGRHCFRSMSTSR